MTKRNGFYYYFDSTHTGCGGEQYGWRSATLSSNPEDWTPLGSVLKGEAPFSGAQHSTAPFQLADGTWWVFSHSYECESNWRGLGRQGLLSQVTWIDDESGAGVPVVNGRLGEPAPAPALPPSDIPFLLPVNDEFTGDKLAPAWTLRQHAVRSLLGHRPRRVAPAQAGGGRDAVGDPEGALHAKAMIVRMDFAPKRRATRLAFAWATPSRSRISRRSRRGCTPSARRCRWRASGRTQKTGSASRSGRSSPSSTPTRAPMKRWTRPRSASMPRRPAERTLWLKLVHGKDHEATGWFSTDRLTWTQVGEPIEIGALEDYGYSQHGLGRQPGRRLCQQRER